MGTRGLLGFVADNHLYATYNHFDSYPGGLGCDVLAYVAQIAAKGPDAVAEAKARVSALKVIEDPDAEPTDADVSALEAWTNVEVGSRHRSGKPDWYQLLRETQGDPEAILASGYLLDGRDFGDDSLFCEWAYVIDFDAEVVEVYRGFRTQPPTRGRWVGRAQHDGAARQAAVTGWRYHPIDLVTAFGFNTLPTAEDFVARVEEAVEGEED